MLCNSSADGATTLISKTHRSKITMSNKPTDENLNQTRKLNVNALINRGGGDCAANDILNREFPKMKLNNDEAMIVLLCEKNSLPFETRYISLVPNTQYIVGRVSSKCRPSELNAYFDCKVLSRQQAVVWCDDERNFWIKDTQSSNGTYLNGSKLHDEAMPLHSGDIIQLGVNVYENKCSEVHNCIVAAVQLYMPSITPKIVVDNNEGPVDATCPLKKLVPQAHCNNTDDYDACATFRTFVDSDASEQSSELSARSGKHDVELRNYLYFKDEETNKPIKVELHSIQSFIEALHNSRLDAWQSISKEDRHLQRIFMLQQKISILKNGISEDVLKNVKQQWEQEKQMYKRAATDAIRRVGLECEDFKLKIEEMETNYKNKEIECDALRDQIDTKEQSINDFSCLLRHIEMDYDECKIEMQTKNAKLYGEFNKKREDLLNKIQQLEKEQENLNEKLEVQEKFETEEVAEFNYETETIIEGSTISDTNQVDNDANEDLAELLEKLQKLQIILNSLENQDKNGDDAEKVTMNFLKFKLTFAELFLQYKELETLRSKIDVMESEEDTLQSAELSETVDSSVETSTKLVTKEYLEKISTSEASEQTIDLQENFEAELDELQAQLIERELCNEHSRDMLETECENYRRKLSELEQENAALLLQQQTAKVEPPEYNDLDVKLEKKPEIDFERVLNDLKLEYSLAKQEKQGILNNTEEQLEDLKKCLNQSQVETLKLQDELDKITDIAQKAEQQHTKFDTMPIIAPIFLGLIGMCIYLCIQYFF